MDSDQPLQSARKPSTESKEIPFAMKELQGVLAPVAVDIPISSSEDLDKIVESAEAVTSAIKRPDKFPPSFIVELQDKQVVEGESVKLEAKVSGNPRPTFSWLKDDDDLKMTDRIRVHEDGEWVCLEIVDVELDDEADYVCIAENELGEAECFAELLVDGKELFLYLFINNSYAVLY